MLIENYEVQYSRLTPTQLLKLHNDLAKRLGKKTRKRPFNRADMVKAIAIFKTMKPPRAAEPSSLPATEKKRRPARAAMIEGLCEISHYEDRQTGIQLSVEDAKKFIRPKDLVSVGFSYNELIARIKKRFKNAKVTYSIIRVEASRIRSHESGYENLTLPMKRQRHNPNPNPTRRNSSGHYAGRRSPNWR